MIHAWDMSKWMEKFSRFGLATADVGVMYGAPSLTNEILVIEHEMWLVEQFLAQQDARAEHPSADCQELFFA